MDISRRILRLSPSPTFAVDAKAKELIKNNISVINLSLGEPDFQTPDNIKLSAITGISKGMTHYTDTRGILELREAVVEKLKVENDLSYSIDEIVVGSGSKLILYEVVQVLCEVGDEVLMPIPCWSTYVEQVKLAGGKPVFIKLHQPFKLKASDVEKHITKKTKIVMLNYPANPTGAVIEKKELEKIAKLAVDNHFWIISDEIYEKIVYTGQHISIASLNEKVKARTITVNGVSKAYAMTGWRIGYAAGPKAIMQAVGNLQGQLTSNASSISQVAAIEALCGPQTSIMDMVRSFGKRRDFLEKQLSKIPQLSFTTPEGSFYYFISVEKLLNKTTPTSQAWCEKLLQTAHVALVPGEAFFTPGYFRLSFAASMEQLQEGVKKIQKYVNEK